MTTSSGTLFFYGAAPGALSLSLQLLVHQYVFVLKAILSPIEWMCATSFLVLLSCSLQTKKIKRNLSATHRVFKKRLFGVSGSMSVSTMMLCQTLEDKDKHMPTPRIFNDRSVSFANINASTTRGTVTGWICVSHNLGTTLDVEGKRCTGPPCAELRQFASTDGTVSFLPVLKSIPRLTLVVCLTDCPYPAVYSLFASSMRQWDNQTDSALNQFPQLYFGFVNGGRTGTVPVISSRVWRYRHAVVASK